MVRRELGLLAVAQRTHHQPHLGEGAHALGLDDAERVDGGVRVLGRDDPAGLGADHDRRDVVRDGVVQLASQLLALTQPHLVELSRPGGGHRAGRAPEQGRDQQHRRGRRWRRRCRVQSRVSPRTRGQHDQRHADGDLAAGGPPDERVGQQHDERPSC